MRNFPVVAFLSALLLASTAGEQVRGDAMAKLTAEKLAAVRQAIGELKAQRREVVRTGPYKEHRANLHVHSKWSHDSRGQIDDIVAAAKRAGTQVLMFTEHPADHYDFVKDGHQGMRDGVLLVPGAEMKGMLVYPRQSIKGLDAGEAQDVSNLVRGRGGLTFLSHLEERMDWEIRGLTGVEIYNTHADFKDEKLLTKSLRNPLWLLGAVDMYEKYPQEALGALQDYPADYLRRWDELCQQAPHTGVSANDAHQNVGLTVRMLEGNKAVLEDALGERVLEMDAAALVALVPAAKDKKPGDTVFQLRLDPYENSLRHVGTHLLMKDFSREGVWEALEAGRAFVAFDWLADATGFDFAAVAGDARSEMGSRATLAPEIKLVGRAPLPGHWKIFRNGKQLAESRGSDCEQSIVEAGVYRAELWLDVAGEERIWVLSNPVYVAAP